MRRITLIAFVLIFQLGFAQTADYKPVHQQSWDKVEMFIHENWHTSKVDSSGASWLWKVGVVPPKPFMTIAKGNPLLFYWDNYFTNRGLLLIDSLKIYAKNGVDNLLWEVERLGFVPNANMNWGMNRSQPPFLAQMVNDVYHSFGDKEWLKTAYSTLTKEYKFWTDTSANAIENHQTAIPGLQRFYHHASKEDLIELYSQCYNRGLLKNHPDSISLESKLKIAGNYAAEAATGMDFNPRFENRCTEFVALELNCNLYQYEKLFSFFVSELGLKNEPDWEKMADKRKELLNKYCWNEQRGAFMDYDFVNKKFSPVFSVASFYPLFCGLATPGQAKSTVEKLALLEYPYGVTICENTNQKIRYQWDYPAGWPPMYLLTAKALDLYGFKKEAHRIAAKYLDVVTKNFLDPEPKMVKEGRNRTRDRKPGFVYEKYNVVTGGINDLEYPANEFIGWSAGVFIWCLDYYRKN